MLGARLGYGYAVVVIGEGLGFEEARHPRMEVGSEKTVGKGQSPQTVKTPSRTTSFFWAYLLLLVFWGYTECRAAGQWGSTGKRIEAWQGFEEQQIGRTVFVVQSHVSSFAKCGGTSGWGRLYILAWALKSANLLHLTFTCPYRDAGARRWY